jgi:hypothetical protein
VDRRELLGWMVATGGLAALTRLSESDLLALGREAHARAPQRTGGAPVLDARETAIVTLAAEQIIPATTTPGATQAGVAAFIETMLGGWYPPADRDRFVAGVRALDAQASARHARGFAECDAAQQLALLEEHDAAVTALRTARDPGANDHWFAMLKYLTVWGYCTSEPGMRETLHSWPMPMRYDGDVKVGS